VNGEAFFSRMLGSLDGALCVVDRSGNIRASNAAFALLAGRTPAALQGVSLRMLLPAPHADTLLAQVSVPDPELCVITSPFGTAGSSRLVARLEVVGSPAPDSDWVLISACAPDADATRQTREALLELTLRQTEGFMGAIMENSPIGIVLTKDRHLIDYNPKFREMFAFRGNEGVGLPGRTLYRCDDEYEALGALATPLLSVGQPVKTEMYMRCHDGSDLWVSLIGYVQNQEDPREGTIWLIQDRSQRKQAEESLKVKSDELAAILDNASVGILFTRNRRFLHCNRRAAEIFGYASAEALIGQPGISIYPDAESYDRVGREAGPLLAAGGSFHTEWLFRKADGSPVWCRIYGKAVDPTRTDQGTVWIVEDITDVKRTEEALHQTLREMEAIMRNAPVGIIFTRERRIFRYNRKLAEMFGASTATRASACRRACCTAPTRNTARSARSPRRCCPKASRSRKSSSCSGRTARRSGST